MKEPTVEKSLKHSVILAIIAGCMAFIGALSGSIFQDYLTDKQKKAEQKREAYARVLWNIGTLPQHGSVTMLEYWHQRKDYITSQNFGDVSPKTLEDLLKGLPPEKLLEVRQAINSARLFAGEKLSRKLAELLRFLELKKTPPLPYTASGEMDARLFLGILCDDILRLMKEEISE